MGAILFIIILFVVCVGGGYVLFSSIGKAMFPDERERRSGGYIDRSVHHHHHHHLHDNRSVHYGSTQVDVKKLEK